MQFKNEILLARFEWIKFLRSCYKMNSGVLRLKREITVQQREFILYELSLYSTAMLACYLRLLMRAAVRKFAGYYRMNNNDLSLFKFEKL